ncbi:MAG: iron ABC transporter permease, partial [Desulfofustis sp.]|nr:iron ABC transporter permease [Desulfofustis sp.]
MNQSTSQTSDKSSPSSPVGPGLVSVLILTGVLVLAMVFSAGLGYIKISPGEILQIIAANFGGHLPDSIDTSYPFVIMEVRLPRIITAVLVGGGLAVAGCIFQSLLQNPLADPYTLGISSGAAFGAS